MKRALIIIFFLFSGFYSYTQDVVFVLVDVSGSVKKEDLAAAKQTLTDVLTGSPLTNAFVPSNLGSLKDIVQCRLKVGDKLVIMKFGNKETVLNNNPMPTDIQNSPGDIYQAISSFYPLIPTDNKTYLTLAKAKVAEFAKGMKLKQYRLYTISDNISDDYGPNGKPDYTDSERELAQSYGTTSSGIRTGTSTKVKLNNPSNRDYVLEFVHSIDISNYTPPGNTIIIPPDSTSQIRITTFSGGTKTKPVKVKGSNINISWSCANCPEGAKFTLTVSGTSGNKNRPKIPALSSQSYSLNNLSGGDYRISVSGQNFNAGSDTVYITVKSGGGGALIWILLLIAAAVVGWWIWKNKRQKKLEEPDASKKEDIFSPKTNPANQGNQAPSNNQYF